MFTEDLKKISAEIDDRDFLQSQIHEKAKNDFKYLCSKTGYSHFNNKQFLTVKTSDSKLKFLGDFLVIGHDVKDKMATFPKHLIDIENPNLYVAVVCYEKGKVVDVLVFKAEGFKTISLFGVYKNLNKQNQYGLSIGDPTNKKMKMYSFGLVLKNLEEN